MRKFEGSKLAHSGYHSYTRGFKKVGNADLAVGFELEVGEFPDRSNTIRQLNEIGVRDDFMMPTSDTSIGGSGIEFVTHPLCVDYLLDEGFKDLGEVFKVLKETGGKAEDSQYSCGCHHNISSSKMANENWDTAIKAVFRYYDLVFAKFHGPKREEHYSVLPGTTDMLSACRDGGKYSFFHFRGNGVVELRFPSMTLDIDKFKTQTNLCLRAIDYAIEHTKFDPLEETFHTIFKPTSDELEMLDRLGVHKRVLSGAY
jgi:hypothetical protein